MGCSDTPAVEWRLEDFLLDEPSFNEESQNNGGHEKNQAPTVSSSILIYLQTFDEQDEALETIAGLLYQDANTFAYRELIEGWMGEVIHGVETLEGFPNEPPRSDYITAGHTAEIHSDICLRQGNSLDSNGINIYRTWQYQPSGVLRKPTLPNETQINTAKKRLVQARSRTNFSLEAINNLQNTPSVKRSHPYPLAEIKKLAALDSGLTEMQLDTWFPNKHGQQPATIEAWLASSTSNDRDLEKVLHSVSQASGSGRTSNASAENSQIEEQEQTPPYYSRCNRLESSTTLAPIRTGPALHSQTICPRDGPERSVTSQFSQCYAVAWAPHPNQGDKKHPRQPMLKQPSSTTSNVFATCDDPMPDSRKRKRRPRSPSFHDLFSEHEGLGIPLATGGESFTSPFNRIEYPSPGLLSAPPPLLTQPNQRLEIKRKEVTQLLCNLPCVSANQKKPEQKSLVSLGTNKGVVFQCTFCHKRLTCKTWKRHEETKHLPQEKWVCMANGFLVVQGIKSICVFCGMSPSVNKPHECHRNTECLGRHVEKRTFSRKDHLDQHLNQFHKSKLPDSTILKWRSQVRDSGCIWYCGFCGDILTDWDARAVHIAKHFRAGLDMKRWDPKLAGHLPGSMSSETTLEEYPRLSHEQ
ncbi:hypothetical protein AOQ84DRAFT_374736 [Glonium stellatum]|uniref:Homeobox domain-containing protein n=1 Tax=Glonium stellatum TaxID=574774 RepID=A0A8E2JVF7_9PEZI|nr:hypothetical protein AOQ84DRAFT_374736 [Glonium stellatum]